MHVETERMRHRPRRVARHRGALSLAARMVLLLLVPLLVAQYFVLDDLGRRQDAAEAARDLADRIDLMTAVEAVYAPAAFEEMTSLGLATVDAIGFDRAMVGAALGFDYEPYLPRARQALDSALDDLASTLADVTLDTQPGSAAGTAGTEVLSPSARLARLRTELAVQRVSLDALQGDKPAITAALGGVIAFADELASRSESGLAQRAEGEIDDLAHEAIGLLAMLQAVAVETRSNSSGLGVSTGIVLPGDAFRASGTASYAIGLYGDLVRSDPDASDSWRRFTDSPAIVAYEQIRPQIASGLELRAQLNRESIEGSPSALVTNPELIRVLADILQRSFDRLAAFEQFTRLRFGELTTITDSIGQQDEQDVANWVILLIVVTVITAAVFALTLWTTVRPLHRLTARARDVSGGQIPVEPLPVTGPTDVRAVTATFNSMLITLATFESHLARLATGDEPDIGDTTSIPGPLGRSLRASVSHLADVTARLRESEALATAIVDTATDAIWTIDEQGRVLSANTSSEQLLGVPTEQQLGNTLRRLFGDRADVSTREGEFEFRRSDGVTVHVLIARSDVAVDGRRLHAVFARDISDRKRFEERLALQARHDVLTGLPNRLAAIERLDEALHSAATTGTPVGVLFLDLDGFKAINDGFGHARGDALLRDVAARLRAGLRESEFVGRLGGDEFLIVAEGLDIDQLIALGTRMIGQVAQPVDGSDELTFVSATAGAALATAGIDGLELIRRADVAVYHAKSLGRGRVVLFDEVLQRSVVAVAEVESALRSAVTADELVLYYQPVIDLRSDRAWGAEVLVRWERPGHGLILPDQFIPIAERSALIIDVERWVLHHSLATLAEWQRDPLRQHLRLAVNISGRHLTDGDLVDDLREALRATGADPSGLEIELTETHLLADLDRANAVLGTLRDWGVRIAVDDFGTGYSSMSYLRQLEIDTLKIDRVFISRIERPGYDRTIVEVLLQLAAALDLDVVAEGVESAEQLAMLGNGGCGRAQGFHVALPMPRAEADRWLDEHHHCHPEHIVTHA